MEFHKYISEYNFISSYNHQYKISCSFHNKIFQTKLPKLHSFPMIFQHRSLSKITLLSKRLKQQAQTKALNQQSLKVIEHHLSTLPPHQLQHSLLQQIKKLQGQDSQCLLLEKWWGKRRKLMRMINGQLQIYQEGKYSRNSSKDVALMERQQQLGRLALLLRHYHFEIAQLLLSIDGMYNIASNSSSTITFYINQIDYLQTRFILNHILCTLYPHTQPLASSLQSIDPFFKELPSHNYPLLKVLKNRKTQKKIQRLTYKILILKAKLSGVVNRHQKQDKSQRPLLSNINIKIPKSLSSIESNRSQFSTPISHKNSNSKSNRNHSHKLAPVKYSNKQRSHSEDNYDFKQNAQKPQSKIQKYTLSNRPYYNPTTRQHQEEEEQVLKGIDQKTGYQSHESRQLAPSRQRTLGHQVREKMKTLSSVQAQHEGHQQLACENEDHLIKQQPKESTFKLKYKMLHKKRKLKLDKPEEKLNKQTPEKSDEVQQQSQAKPSIIRCKQYTSYNPTSKQPFTIRQTANIKYTLDTSQHQSTIDQASQTTNSLLPERKELSLQDKHIQTMPHIDILSAAQNDGGGMRYLKMEEDIMRQLQEQVERTRINQLLQFVEENTNSNFKRSGDHQLTICQEYLIEQEEEPQKLTIRTINQVERSHIHSKLQTKAASNKRQISKQIVVDNVQGRDIRMILWNYGEKEMTRLIDNVQIAQQYRDLFKMDKLLVWMNKRQTYHLQFRIDGQVAVEVVFSPVYLQTILLKLWAPINQAINQQQSSFLFSELIKFLSTLRYYRKVMYIGASFSQLQANHFKQVKDNIYVKDIDTFKPQPQPAQPLQPKPQQIRRYFNLQLVCFKYYGKAQFASLAEQLFIDEEVLQTMGLCRDVELKQDLGKLLNRSGLKINVDVKVDHCTFFKETLQFKTPFIANYPFYHFSQISIIQQTPHPIYRISTTINQAFIYLAPSSSLSAAISAVGSYNRNEEFRKESLLLRMFNKNIEVGKIDDCQLIVGQFGGCWQKQFGLLQVQMKREVVMEGTAVCLLQFSGKIAMALLIKQADYLYQ